MLELLGIGHALNYVWDGIMRVGYLMRLDLGHTVKFCRHSIDKEEVKLASTALGSFEYRLFGRPFGAQ